MQAPAPPDARPPESYLPYLTGSQAAILECLREEYAGEVHPVLTEDLEAAVDEHPDAQTPAPAAAAQLAEWGLVTSRRVPGDEDGERVEWYMLTDPRGKELVLARDDLDSARKPFLEWTRQERESATFSQAELFHRLFEEVAALREDVGE